MPDLSIWESDQLWLRMSSLYWDHKKRCDQEHKPFIPTEFILIARVPTSSDPEEKDELRPLTMDEFWELMEFAESDEYKHSAKLDGVEDIRNGGEIIDPEESFRE